MNIAYLFPGQGAQTPGFLKRLAPHPDIAETLREAQDVLLDLDIDALDRAEALRSTVNVQLGCLIAGVAVSTANPNGVRSLSGPRNFSTSFSV